MNAKFHLSYYNKFSVALKLGISDHASWQGHINLIDCAVLTFMLKTT